MYWIGDEWYYVQCISVSELVNYNQASKPVSQAKQVSYWCLVVDIIQHVVPSEIMDVAWISQIETRFFLFYNAKGVHADHSANPAALHSKCLSMDFQVSWMVV